MFCYSFALLAVVSQLVQCQVDPSLVNPEAVDPKCNFSYNKTGPIIRTLNFPDKYPDNKKCAWTIESPEEAADITIQFHYFEVESGKRCTRYDYMLLYKQGNGQSNWEQIGYLEGYCGKQDPFQVTDTAKRVRIYFVTDISTAYSGFNATFDITITQQSPKILCLSLLGDPTCNRQVVTEERSTLTVQCKASAIPPAVFTWERMINYTHGEPIRDEIVKNKFPNGSIQFHQLDRDIDNGTYRCIATNKHNTVKDKFVLDIKEKCMCPKYLKVSWYPLTPYTKYTIVDNKNRAVHKGLFYVILTKMIAAVCKNCTGGHGETVIQWQDNHNRKKDRGLSEVKGEIESRSADIYLPIEGGKEDDKYRNVYYFLPIIDSPGVAFLIIGSEEGASAVAIFDSIVQGWPIFVLTIVMAALAGIIMWMLDTYWNEEQFPRAFSEGIVEGFWWAFVTMTTVGYGDIAPVGVPGRLFAVIWILTGLVIIAIFTGVITTSLTVTALSTKEKLYGTNVGAINNTAEYRMGVVKNAKMKNYYTYDEMKNGMDNRAVKGCLLDSYVAAYHKDKFGSFRVNSIISAHKAYGIVLGEKLSTKELYKGFANYLEKNKAEITKDIEANVDTLTEPKTSAAEEASASLFDPKSELFVKSMTASCIILLILTVGGLFFEYGYLRPRHRMIESAKNLDMVESAEVKEMARRARELKESLLYEVDSFYSRWAEKLGNLTTKHKAEQKKLTSSGRSTGPPSATWGSQNASNVEEAVELDGGDVVDGPSSPGGESSRSNGSGKSFRSDTSSIEEKKRTSEV